MSKGLFLILITLFTLTTCTPISDFYKYKDDNDDGTSIIASIQPNAVTGLQLWLKADSIGQSDGTAVITWNDSSGNGNNATASAAPTFKTNILNGQPVIRFDGAITFMTMSEFMNFSNVTMIIVGKTVSTSAFQRYFSDMGNSVNEHLVFWINISDNLVITARDTSSNVINPTTLNEINVNLIMSGSLSGTTINLFKNGNLVTSQSNPVYITTTTWDGAAGPPTIGKQSSTTSEYLNGDIAEVIVYNSALSDADRQGVECYLSNKYAISVSQTCQ